MKEFRELFLAPDWEGTIQRKLMGSMMGSGLFWDYATATQNLNILLTGTQSHLSDIKLRHQLEVGMTDKLAKKCQNKKVGDIEDLCKWMLEVKRVDDDLRTECIEFEEISRMARNESCKANALGEPSRRANIANTNNNQHN
jgi:hypothetical protein